MRSICTTCILFFSASWAYGQGVLDDKRPDPKVAATQALQRFLDLQDEVNRNFAFLARIEKFRIYDDRITESRGFLFRVSDEESKKSRTDLVTRGKLGLPRVKTQYTQQVKDGSLIRQSSGLIDEYYLPDDIAKPGYRNYGPLKDLDPFSATIAGGGETEATSIALLSFQIELVDASYGRDGMLTATWKGTRSTSVLALTVSFDPQQGDSPRVTLWRIVKDWNAQGDDRFSRTISRTESDWIQKGGRWLPESIIYSGRDGGNKFVEDRKLVLRWGEPGDINSWLTEESISQITEPDLFFEDLWEKWSAD